MLANVKFKAFILKCFTNYLVSISKVVPQRKP
jgi:hypothetical protein